MSPGTIYVESDLPHLMIHKVKLIRNTLIDEEHDSRGVLHCCTVDVLNQKSVMHSLDVEKPFTMVTEGLLLYFGQTEMNESFHNISIVLNRYEHDFRVTDFVTQQNLKELFMSDPDVARGVKDVFSLTGRNVFPDNPFEGAEAVGNYLLEFDLQIDKLLPLASTTGLLDFEVPLAQEKRDRIVGSRSIYRIKRREAS